MDRLRPAPSEAQTPLFPTISLDSYCPVEVNFGAKPFLFDLPAFEADVRRLSLSSNIPQLHDQVRGGVASTCKRERPVYCRDMFTT